MIDILIFIILLIGFLGIYFIIQNSKDKISDLPSFRGILLVDKEKIQEKWRELEQLMRLGGESRFKTAIVEADKLLMSVLEMMGFEGPGAEKLQKAKNLFSDYNGIWQAHLLRNEVVHNIDVKIIKENAQEAIGKFKQGLKDLGVL